MITCLRLLTTILMLLSILTSFAKGNSEHSKSQKYQSTMHIFRFKSIYEEMTTEERASIKDIVMKYSAELDKEIAKIEEYDARKQNQIDVAKKRLEASQTDAERYEACDRIYKSYISVSYDSIYHYLNKCVEYATALNDKEKLARSQINLVYLFLNVSYFKEASELLNMVDLEGCSEELKLYAKEVEFRLEFSDGFYFPWYLYTEDKSLIKMTEIYDEVGRDLPENHQLRLFMEMAINFHKHAYNDATYYAKRYAEVVDKESHDYPEALGDIGYNYNGMADYENAMKYMTESAIISIRRGYKNYSALRKIAEMLYVTGDLDRAYNYEIMAMTNANTYNSKYRIIEAAKGLMPITEDINAQLNTERTRMKVSIVFLSLLVIVLIALIIRTRRLSSTVSDNEINLKQKNEELQKQNAQIELANKSLSENHRITSVLMGHIMSANATRLDMLKKLNKTVARRLKTRDYEGMLSAVRDFSDERKSIFPSTDEIIAIFFPTFAEQFNALLREDSRFEITDNKKMPAEMKIFALWRMGVTKNEDIANCLDYSVYTIKSYKTRVMNATDLDKDEFYEQLMKINVADMKE